MAAIAKHQGLKALNDPQYMNNQQNSIIFGTIQATTIIFAVFISTLKSWKRKKQAKIYDVFANKPGGGDGKKMAGFT